MLSLFSVIAVVVTFVVLYYSTIDLFSGARLMVLSIEEVSTFVAFTRRYRVFLVYIFRKALHFAGYIEGSRLVDWYFFCAIYPHDYDIPN